MPVFVITAGLVATGAIGLALALRRRIPRLTDQDLDSIPGLPSNLRVAPTNCLAPEEREAIKEAFLAGSDFRWLAVGDDYPKANFDNPTSEAAKIHKDITWYTIEKALRLAEKYADVLVLTENPRGSTDPGKFLGCVSILPAYTSRVLFNLHCLPIDMSMGKPPHYSEQNGLKERLDAFDNDIQKAHHEVMGKSRHWCLMLIGVAKSAQGKGAGKQLIKAAIAISGNNEEPLYLECHNENVSFYKKMGFKLAQRYQFKVKDGAPNSCKVPYHYNAMVHGA